MEEEIKKLEQAMNDYIVESNGEGSIIYNNIGLFYELSIMIEETLFKYASEDIKDEDYLKLTKISLFDGINLIKKFYSNHNIDFDMDKYLNNGTIDLEYYDEFSEIGYNRFTTGINYYENNEKLIDSCNNGVITDILVLIHELGHFRNQPDISRNQVSDLLTEALGYTDELIFMDYLKEVGFENDVELFKKHLFHTFYCNAKNIRPIYKLFLLYECMGNISKDCYELFYGDSEYESIIEYMIKFSDNKKFYLYFEGWYIFGSILSSYMYQQYKKDPNFINVINLLHRKINDSSVTECLNLIGLSDLGEEDQEILSECLTLTIGQNNNQLKKSL